MWEGRKDDAGHKSGTQPAYHFSVVGGPLSVRMDGPFGRLHPRPTTPRKRGKVRPMIRASNLRRLVFVLLAGAACSGERSPSARMTEPSPSASSTWNFNGATLIQCPTNTTLTATGIIGPLGGVLAAGYTLVIIPPKAV